MTSVNVFELVHTARSFSQQKKDALLNLQAKLRVLDLDGKSALIAGVIGTKLSRTGQTLRPINLLTGAISVKNGMELITRKVDHFSRIEDLKMRKWKKNHEKTKLYG